MRTTVIQTQKRITADERLVLSVPEAAALLGIYELAVRGELPTLWLGWRVVVPRVALLALVRLPAVPPERRAGALRSSLPAARTTT
ncbi:MAG: hypothetical protein ACRD0Z_03220 [Acidimicrobiales bacterium]